MATVLAGGHGSGNYSCFHVANRVTTNFHRHSLYVGFDRLWGRFRRKCQYRKAMKQKKTWQRVFIGLKSIRDLIDPGVGSSTSGENPPLYS